MTRPINCGRDLEALNTEASAGLTGLHRLMLTNSTIAAGTVVSEGARAAARCPAQVRRRRSPPGQLQVR